MRFSTAVLVASTFAFATAKPAYDLKRLVARATLPVPASQGSVTFSKAEPITNFDGGMKTFGRGVKCTGQKEGGSADAVFIIKDGGSLSNAIIGADQIEGVHCEGACTITNVWWTEVCEDALSLKGNGNALIVGGGAANAEDKVIQHNGIGTVTIDGFTVNNFGKLYRSCGNCKSQGKRNVVVKNVKASDGKVITGINSNFGDTSTITGTCATSVKAICEEFEGNSTGKEPKKISSGPSNACKFTNPLPKC